MSGAQQLDNQRLVGRIRELYEDSRHTLVAGRMHEDLVDQGASISLNRVANLMATEGLQGWLRPKRRGQSDQLVLTPPGVRNLLERNFTVLEPKTRWVTDISEIRTGQSQLYLCSMLDLLDQRVVGSMYHQQDKRMVIQTMQMAVWQRQGDQRSCTRIAEVNSGAWTTRTSHDVPDTRCGKGLCV